MTIPNLASCKLVQELNMPDGVIANNIYYFEANFNTPQEVEDVLTALVTWVETLYTTIDSEVSDLLELGEFTLYTWNAPLLQWDNEGSDLPAVTFTGVSDMLPHGVSALVRAYSFNTRSIARKYLAGFIEEAQADGTWITSTLTALAAFGAEWSSSSLVSSGNTMRAAVWDTKIFTTHILTGVEVVLTEPAYQRRRRPGVGI